MKSRSPPSSITSKPTVRTRRRPAIADAQPSQPHQDLLLRNDIERSLQYTAAGDPLKARQQPATYLEADGRPQKTGQGNRGTMARLHIAAVPLQLRRRASEVIDVQWADLQLAPPRQARLRGKGKKDAAANLARKPQKLCTNCGHDRVQRSAARLSEPAWPAAAVAGWRSLHLPQICVGGCVRAASGVGTQADITRPVSMRCGQSGTDVTVMTISATPASRRPVDTWPLSR